MVVTLGSTDVPRRGPGRGGGWPGGSGPPTLLQSEQLLRTVAPMKQLEPKAPWLKPQRKQLTKTQISPGFLQWEYRALGNCTRTRRQDLSSRCVYYAKREEAHANRLGSPRNWHLVP